MAICLGCLGVRFRVQGLGKPHGNLLRLFRV